MEKDDDFFVGIRDQLIADIEEYTNLSTAYFNMRVWHRERGHMRKHSWKDLSMVEWTYHVEDKKRGRYICHFGGWMHLQGGNWAEFYSQVMGVLVGYDRERREFMMTGKRLEDSEWLNTGYWTQQVRPTQISSAVSPGGRRSQLATLPVAWEEPF